LASGSQSWKDFFSSIKYWAKVQRLVDVNDEIISCAINGKFMKKISAIHLGT